MRPVLYAPGEYSFSTNGIGHLKDCLSCKVTEERNGVYELEMEYPASGIFYEELKIFNIILAKPNESDRPQPFDIYKVIEDGAVAKVYARHICYRMAFMPVQPFTGAGNVGAAITKLKAGMVFGSSKYDSANYGFNDIYHDGNDVSTAFYTETCYAAKEILNKMAATYKKDLKYDRFRIGLIHRGSDNGVVVRYGANLTRASKERTAEGAYNCVCDYWYQKDKGIRLGSSSTVSKTKLPYPRALVENVSSEYNNDNIPSVSALDSRATAMLTTQTTDGRLSVDIDMAALWESSEFEAYRALSKVELCDTVRVWYPEINLDIKLTVEKIVFDSLSEKIEKIVLGDQGEDLSTTMTETRMAVAEAEENHLINVFGGRACTAGTINFSYKSATRMKASISTGLSFVENCTVSLGGDNGTPWAQVTSIGIKRNTPSAGSITVTVAGSGFVSAHVLIGFFQAIGSK